MATLDLFPNTKPARAKRRVLMHVSDAGEGYEGKPICLMKCPRCDAESNWLQFGSVAEAKRGIPCDKCNAIVTVHKNETTVAGTYTLAKREPPGGFYINPPELVRVIQRGIQCDVEDFGKFVIGVVLVDQDTERFVTPMTSQDKVFWSNGLDGVNSIGESILLFTRQDEAIEAAQKWKWQSAAIYKLVLDETKQYVWLEVVTQACRDKARH